MEDLESLLARLLGHQVEFVIVGGYAAAAHGVTLVTADVDICCRFSAENLLRLQRALSGLHPVHRMTPARLPLDLSPDRCAGLKNLCLATDWGQLDCLGAMAGVGDFDRVLEQSEEIELPYGRCRLLGLRGLIASKEAMGRPRDREALIQLKALAERGRPGRA